MLGTTLRNYYLEYPPPLYNLPPCVLWISRNAPAINVNSIYWFNALLLAIFDYLPYYIFVTVLLTGALELASVRVII